jgi:transposase
MSAALDELPTDPNALRALLLAERVRHADELAAARGEAERLIAIIKELQRHRFGRRAERLDADQLALALEDLEQTLAATMAAAETDGNKPARLSSHKRRINRGALPPHLPREEITIDVADKSCPCCGGLKHRIGEDVSERLEMIPAQFKVLVVRRPKYACRACEGEVTQAPAPERLIENGIPTEALVAHVIVAKYADHLPLYRQAQIYARQGIALDRSTLADWVGRAAFALRPVHARLFEGLKSSTKLFADETTAPVLDPGRGCTKKGQLWAYARDERPWAGPDPPGIAYVYAPDRKHVRPAEHLAGFSGTLQVDGYGAYADLAEGGHVVLAFCWSHVRRRFYEIQAATPAPIASEARRYPRPDRTSASPAAARQADHQCIAALARSAAYHRLGQIDDCRGDPLRALALGRARPVPRRRPYRDRLQCRRARHASDRTRTQEPSLCRLGWRRRALGGPRLADRNLQDERRRSGSISARCTDEDRQPPSNEPLDELLPFAYPQSAPQSAAA